MLRPLHDWILIELDPIAEREGLLFLPHGQVVRTATVKIVGPGKSLPTGVRVPVGVVPGDRIAFRREHLEHKPGKQQLAVLQEFGENLGLLRAPDILYVIEEDAEELRTRLLSMKRAYKMKHGRDATHVRLTPREETIFSRGEDVTWGDALVAAIREKGLREAVPVLLGMQPIWDAPSFEVGGAL